MTLLFQKKGNIIPFLRNVLAFVRLLKIGAYTTPNFLKQYASICLINFITEFQHGIKPLVIELILNILNRIKFDYTMWIKFLHL